MQYYVKTSQYFTDKNKIYDFECRKYWKCVGIQKETIRVAASLQMTIM